MSPPLLSLDGDGDRLANVSLMTSTSSTESIFQTNPELTKRNYLGLQDCSSVDSSDVPSISETNKDNLNFKATELRLGLPGSQSPERDSKISLASLLPFKDGICSSSQKTVVSGNKRGFSATMESCSEMKVFPAGNWMITESDASKSLGQGKFSNNVKVNGMIMLGAQIGASKVPQEQSHATSGTSLNKVNGSNPSAAKAQVVGWPPVRSFRKNILATSSKNNDEVNGKPGIGALFVKVSMDGAPYLRKVNLRTYSTYHELSSSLEKMFSCFTIGQCGSQSPSGSDSLCESKLRDLLHGSEYVLTYEDKDGDWMLVGDVPWDMFIGSCKRLKIMKGSDAIGLAPRANEKLKSLN